MKGPGRCVPARARPEKVARVDEFVMPLPLALDVVSLTMGLVNIASPTGTERPLADSVEQALRTQAHLTVERYGDTVVARTGLGHAERVVLLAHLDTAATDSVEPSESDEDEDDLLANVEMGTLSGPGACDAKGGIAVLLKSASLGAGELARDVTLVLHAGADGPQQLVEAHPDVLAGDLLVTVRPTGALVESGSTVAFAALGVPELAYGPGDPAVAGTPEEHVPTAQLTECEHTVREWLRGRAELSS
jgi:acetylornithine deacetylase/succinyl-diaminopimelate desuccinylase-like protein